MDPVFISLVSACTALAASIAGPIVTLSVARRQFNATVLSANRQRWIEALRDSLAELISLIVIASVVKAGWKAKWERGQGALTANPDLMEKVARIVLIQCRIRLLLNPTENDHQELFQAIDAAMKRLQSEEVSDTGTESDIEHITRHGQSILKREWIRVKRGV
jgi:hypothetical protein